MNRILARLALIALLTSAFALGSSATPASAAGPAWWNASYSDRLAINVHANDAITSGYSLDVVINHARMVSQGVSLASGDDVRIAYYNGTSWTELDRVLAYGSSWNNAATDLVFKTQAAVSTNSDDTGYYLYYGNGAAVSPPANANNVYVLWDDFSAATLDTTKWNTALQTGVTADTSTGALRLTGTPTGSAAYGENQVFTNTSLSSGIAVESTFAIVSQSSATSWKAAFGASYGQIGVSGSTVDKRTQYWNGMNTVDLGDSTLDAQTITPTRVKETIDNTGTIKHYETGALQAQRFNGQTTAYPHLFMFANNTQGASFDVRFDDVSFRKFVTNEPRVSIEGANDIAFVTSVAPVFVFTVATHSGGTCNGVAATAGTLTTGSSIAIGRVNSSAPAIAAQDIAVNSNANSGFVVNVSSPAVLTSGSNTIPAIVGTNATPVVFPAGAGFGYKSAALSRFNGKWAGLSTTPSEALSGLAPVVGASSCMLYQLQVAANTPAASYAGSLIYSAVPTF